MTVTDNDAAADAAGVEVALDFERDAILLGNEKDPPVPAAPDENDSAPDGKIENNTAKSNSTGPNAASLRSTYGHLIANRLSKYRWYNPHRLDEEEKAAGEKEEDVDEDEEEPNKEMKPSLEAAWKFFEFTTLPRYILSKADGDREEEIAGNKRSKKAKKRWAGTDETDGDNSSRQHDTALYPYWNTSEMDLMGFGIGVVQYFFFLRYMVLLCIIAGFISLANMIFYASDDYSPSGQWHLAQNLSYGVLGSAVCPDQNWVACSNCAYEVDDTKPLFGRFFNNDPARTAIAPGPDNSTLVFRLKNECEVGFTQGMLVFGAFLFLLIAVLPLHVISDRWGMKMDKTDQTADDYTIWIRNPPKDARDPEEWKSFFQQFISDKIPGDHMVSCTVAVENRRLLEKLVQRRTVLRQLELLVKEDVIFDPTNLDEMVAAASPSSSEHERPFIRHFVNSFLFARVISLTKDAKVLKERIEALNEEIEAMANDDYPVLNVFVTFDTEHSMLNAMKALALSRSTTNKKNVESALSSNYGPCRTHWQKMQACWRGKLLESSDYLFRGCHILYVDRPPPPTSICWRSLGAPLKRIIFEQVISYLVVAGLIVAGVFLIVLAEQQSTFLAACVISALSLVGGMALNTVTSFESHNTEDERGASRYSKLTIFRWVNTAVLWVLVTPLTSFLNPDDTSLIYKIYSLFFSELIFGPLLALMDPMGQIQRHLLGPRAATQKNMNLNFQGSYWTLAEKKVEVTKVFFLACFYSSLFPAGFFFAALVLTIDYCTDKFLLLRTLRPGPKIGNVGQASNMQQTFLILAILLYIIHQYYLFTGIPYDQTCLTGDAVENAYLGEHQATTLAGTRVSVYIDQDENDYEFCEQKVSFETDFTADSSVLETWMTPGQIQASKILFHTVKAILSGGICRIFMIGFEHDWTRKRKMGNLYKCSEETVDDKFSEQKELGGYVPQIPKAAGFLAPFTHPFLAVDTSNIDARLVGWGSKENVETYNLWNDFPDLYWCFSKVHQWRSCEHEHKEKIDHDEQSSEASSRGEKDREDSFKSEEICEN